MAAISQTMARPMSPRPPFCVLMAGLPGSGKTTLSRALTVRGFVRLCPDEEMYRRHGVYGVDFPRGIFPTLERPVLEDVAVELRDHLKAGHDVVVDHGFWTPKDRAHWQAIATDAGATPVLVYLAETHDELWARVSKRNEFHENDPNSIYFSESDLQRYRTRFIPPESDEPHVLYNGGPSDVIAVLEDPQIGPPETWTAQDLPMGRSTDSPARHKLTELSSPHSCSVGLEKYSADLNLPRVGDLWNLHGRDSGG